MRSLNVQRMHSNRVQAPELHFGHVEVLTGRDPAVCRAPLVP